MERNIVITGASSGIGYQAVLHLAKDPSHRIFAIARNAEKLYKLVEDAKKEGGGVVVPVKADLTSVRDCEHALAEISKQTDSIHVLVNNAGRLVNKPFEELTDADWMEVYSVNVFAMVRLTRMLLPMIRKGSSDMRTHIVNISSMGGVQGAAKFAGLSAYTSGKSAVIALTECLALELMQEQISVNCLALGSAQTEMFSQAFPSYKASMSSEQMGIYVAEFAIGGHRFFNGKTLPVSVSTP